MASKKQTQISPYNIILPVIIFVLILGFAVRWLLPEKIIAPQQTNMQMSPSTVQNRIETGDGSYAIATGIPHQMKFVSPKLGISFLYLSELGTTQYPQPVAVKEVGDKVYIYDPKFEKYTEGKFVQIFKKDPQDDLSRSIQKTILKGYNSNDCFVLSDKSSEQHLERNYPYKDNIFTAAISYPGWNGTDAPPQQADLCPAIYSTSGSIAYFLMDKYHSDMFVFFSLGQDNFPADPSSLLTWDETLEFLH